ncbi:hypothetical protein Ciccas_012446 [Cichlidogyrus casuarinus]|uniref:Uncharacterized protein n=1 Tax=Cichlidogyrus casuarinus TaxID=1844966 RepID=A0ABD2PQP7_9PLAT
MSGVLQARVVGPSGTEEEAHIHQLDPEQHSVRFTPHENGPHLVHVLMNGMSIPGSPFQVLVGQEGEDATLVHASGDGLMHGKVGERNHFFVNTAHAGSGSLSVTVDGPSKVQLNCSERNNGYEFTYTALAPGHYTISINYGSERQNIPGSPFRAYVSGGALHEGYTADSSRLTVHTSNRLMTGPQRSLDMSYPERVVCLGQGLERAFLNMVNSFNVDTNQAGNDVLYVGVSGPVVPCEEVNIKHQGNGQYSVHYTVRDRGEHWIMVKWGDRHVPGSPFMVMVN